MGEELDRMMGLRRWSNTFLLLLILAIAFIIGLIIYMNTGDYAGTNKDFNKITTQNNVEQKIVELESFSKLCFFSQNYNNQRTLFTNTLPTLKIVDSEEYKVEFSANGDLLDKLELTLEEDALCIDFNKKYYRTTTSMGKTYRGLYIDCTEFTVTVYAPVTYLVSDAELNLDFEAPATKTLVVAVNGEITNGRIYDVNSDAIGVFVAGSSNVTVEGESREYTELLVKHNSKLDVSALDTPLVSETVASQLFGISSIRHANKVRYSFDNLGFIMTAVIVFIVLVLLAGVVFFRILFLKQKKEIDQFIEQVEKEGNFLQNP